MFDNPLFDALQNNYSLYVTGIVLLLLFGTVILLKFSLSKSKYGQRREYIICGLTGSGKTTLYTSLVDVNVLTKGDEMAREMERDTLTTLPLVVPSQFPSRGSYKSSRPSPSDLMFESVQLTDCPGVYASDVDKVFELGMLGSPVSEADGATLLNQCFESFDKRNIKGIIFTIDTTASNESIKANALYITSILKHPVYQKNKPSICYVFTKLNDVDARHPTVIKTSIERECERIIRYYNDNVVKRAVLQVPPSHSLMGRVCDRLGRRWVIKQYRQMMKSFEKPPLFTETVSGTRNSDAKTSKLGIFKFERTFAHTVSIVDSLNKTENLKGVEGFLRTTTLSDRKRGV